MRFSMLCRALFLTLLPALATAAGTFELRMDSDQRQQLPADAEVVWEQDYGTFRWLSVRGIDAADIDAAGLAGTRIDGSGVLHIGRIAFDPLRGVPNGTDHRFADGSGLHLLQYRGPLRDEWLATLHDQGVEVLQYYANNALLVHAPARVIEGLESLSELRWSGPWLDSYKQEQGLDQRSGQVENISVLFHPRGPVDQVTSRFEQLGFKLLGVHPAQPDRKLWEAILGGDASQMAALAAQPEVLVYAYASPRGYLEDEMSSQIMAGNYTAAGVPSPGYGVWLDSPEINLNGEGVIWAVTDSGIDYSHPDFAGRIAGGFTYPGCPAGKGPGDDPSSGGHGTHVAGIIAGPAQTGVQDTAGYLYGLGVAPGARLFAQNTICAGGVQWPPAGGWQVLSRNAILGGAIGTNNSWTSGEGTNAGYTSGARTHDIMVRDGNFDSEGLEPFFIVFSAGNSGSGAGTLTAPKEAKNPIITASSLNQRAGLITELSGFSSRGPTRDGRHGMTVAAPGSSIASTRRVAGASSCATAIPGTAGQYAFCSGTSMAAPHIAGSLALLTEQWRRDFNGATPSPAMGKALLVNGALDITSSPIPNTSQGWGRAYLPDALGIGTLREVIDQEVVLTETGDEYLRWVGIPDPDKPLKVTLVWTDPPGAVGTGLTLVNNLDLSVLADSGSYLGNVFSGGVSVTGGSADTLNNIENVFIAEPGFSAEIRIRASSLGGDALLATPPQLRQDFALVCSNCALQPDFSLSTSTTRLTLCAPATGQVDVAVGQILGYGDPVTLAVSGVPAGLTAQFAQNVLTPPNSTSLNLSDSVDVLPGSYQLNISATSTTGSKSRNLALNVFDGTLLATQLLAPADGATLVQSTPTFSWESALQTETYQLQIATDPGFADIIVDETLNALEFSVSQPLAAAQIYYWRVRAANQCNDGNFSAVSSFQTAPEAGDCLPAEETLEYFSENVDGDVSGWQTSTPTGSATWAVSADQPLTAPHSWFALNVNSVADQRLTSPAFMLPKIAQLPVLVFSHVRNIESGSPEGCWDGGVLEVAMDGSAFVQVPPAQLLAGAYDGVVSASTPNPLGGTPAWCGSASNYSRVVVDMSPYQGSMVQLRFRLGSDASVGRPGWHVDDISVQSCAPPRADPIFADGFEGVQ